MAKFECGACQGTGLYQGFMERKAEAVVCISCGGSGHRSNGSRTFTGRKPKPGVTSVRTGSGLILDNPAKASWLTYSEFARRFPEA